MDNYYDLPDNMNQQGNRPTQPDVGKGNGIASMVLGIIGVLLLLFGGLGAIITLILGIIALVEVKTAKKKGYFGGFVTAGKVLGIIAVAGAALLIIFSLITVIVTLSAYGQYLDMSIPEMMQWLFSGADVNDITGVSATPHGATVLPDGSVSLY